MPFTRLLAIAIAIFFYTQSTAQTVCGKLCVGKGGVRYLVVVIEGRTDTFWAKAAEQPVSFASNSSESDAAAQSTSVSAQGRTVVIDNVDTVFTQSTVTVESPPKISVEELEQQLKEARESAKLKKKLARKEKREKKREKEEGEEDDGGIEFGDLLLGFLKGIAVVIGAPIALALGLAAGAGWLLWKIFQFLSRPFRKCNCDSQEEAESKSKAKKKKGKGGGTIRRHGRKVRKAQPRASKRVRGRRRGCSDAFR